MDGRAPPPPPPPPPHGNNGKSSGLPPGNYDIFVIPPHSSGSGFLYLPSLAPHRNSFLAGVLCTLVIVGIWVIVVPVLRQWLTKIMASGGVGVLLLVAGVGAVCWAYGKTQAESASSGHSGSDSAGDASSQKSSSNSGRFHHTHTSSGPSPFTGSTFSGSTPFTNASAGAGTSSGAKPSWQRTNTGAATGGFEQYRENLKKRQEEIRKKEETERKAKETAEKERLDKARARDREIREKEVREKIAQERAKKEAKEKEAKASTSAHRNYQKPTAHSYVGDDDAYSYRPYDHPPKHAEKTNSQTSFFSESSYTASHTTARTTPPPSQRGPYSNKDPDKVTIKAVYAFKDHFPRPVAQLISGAGNVTNGLILRMTTEGLFIDDDVRGVPQREWDVKAWTMKLVESGNLKGIHVLRASIRDEHNRRYVFVIDETEAWKVAVGLQRLRRGSQVRSLGQSGLSPNETKGLLSSLGWV